MKLFILFISLLSLALSACTDETAMPSDDRGSSNVTIRIKPPRSITPLATRAESGEADAEAESKITLLTIRLASEKGDIGICRFSEATGDLPPIGEDGLITLSPQMKMNLDNLGYNNTLYVYANKEDDTVLDELGEEDDLWNGEKVKPLVMSGKSPLEMDGSSYWGTVVLTRQLAKVEVRVSLSEDCVPSNLRVLYDRTLIAIRDVPTYSFLYEHRDEDSQRLMGYNLEMGASLRKVKDEFGHYIPGRVLHYSYVHEQYPPINDNVAPSFRGLACILIVIRVADPTSGRELPGSISKTLYIRDGDGILRRNHVYSLDVKILSADKMSTTLTIADWDSTLVNGMEGNFLNMSETEVRMPAVPWRGDTVLLHTDLPEVTLEYDTNTLDRPVEMEYRKPASDNRAVCIFGWKNDILPDYNIDIPLYLVGGNVRKKIRLLYTVPEIPTPHVVHKNRINNIE